MLGTAFDLLLVIFGFGAIVFVHELGHFLAARWAGIRVLAFAIGFGPALCSYRKGLGFRRGGSEREYNELVHARKIDPVNGPVSPTEYRFNALPFGGYVKMLGQDDLDPASRSSAADSYQSVKPWKRMIVISAGVIMNLITAALLFVLVFMVGRSVSPPVLGRIEPGSAASVAASVDSTHSDGLRTGDRVIRIDGRTPRSFDDVVLAVAMARKDKPLPITVERAGAGQLQYTVTPREDPFMGQLTMGVEPSLSAKLMSSRREDVRRAILARFKSEGLHDLKPGMTLVSVNSQSVSTWHDAEEVINQSDGKPVRMRFAASDGSTQECTLQSTPRLESGLVRIGPKSVAPVSHLLGMTGVMRVADATPDGGGPKASDQGLRDGDIFARIGELEFPALHEGLPYVRARKGKAIDMSVLREHEPGVWQRVELPGVKVSRDGRVGFLASDTADTSPLLARPIAETMRDLDSTPASRLGLTPGSQLVEIAGEPATTLARAREAIRSATRLACQNKSGASMPIKIRRPVRGVPDADAPLETLTLELSESDVARVHALGWKTTLDASYFEPAEIDLKASTPWQALRLGISETHRVMMSTYLTFARLAQGSVKVEHLKGPVGIAHLGTLIADRGIIWLLFFLALISVNLAVINFLPLPIVDGGQFLFLVYEAIRGRPVPVGFQNAVTMAGLVLIGMVFLFVTYNDIRGLLGI